jgi:Bifunctional DNA primase/polymerase, N-terminal
MSEHPLPGKTPAACAARYAELGFALTPIAKGAKFPIGKRWNEPRSESIPDGYVTDPSIAEKVWSNGLGMGGVLAPSGMVTLDVDDLETARWALKAVDIDLDCLLSSGDAVLLNGNPDHRKLVFRAPPGESLPFRKLVWKRGEDIVIPFELRSGPVQDVLPPTVHPTTGRPYWWSRAWWEAGKGLPPLPPDLRRVWEGWDGYLVAMDAACPWGEQKSTKASSGRPTVVCPEFDEAASQEGLIKAAEGWIDDGEIHRCHAIGPDGPGHKKDGSYILFPDEPRNGFVQNHHRRDRMIQWKAKEPAPRAAADYGFQAVAEESVAVGSIPPAQKIPEENQVPSVIYTSGDLPTATAAAWQAVEMANNPPSMFRYGGVPTRLGADDTDRPAFEVLGVDRMRHVVARVAPWKTKRLNKTTGEMVEREVPPPIDVIRDLLATPADSMPLPVVSGIAEVPTFAADGTLCNTPGYNAANKTYYAPPQGLLIPEIPTAPTDEDVRRARELLIEPLAEIPFAGDSDLAHTLALVLLPYVREFIGHASPIHLFDAPIHGSGKTLAATIALKPAMGDLMFVTQADDDEFRKRITALAIAGRPVFFLDNVTRPLNSATLAMALSAATWTDRILGKTMEVSIPNRMIWVVTGNNVALSGELARRSVRVRIDPNTDQPWLRNGFRIKNLNGWLAQNRAALVAAALTLIRAWVNDGMKPWSGAPLGGFEQWSYVIGGILDRTGVGGFLGNLDELYEAADVENAVWREFVTVWWERHQDGKVGTADLFPIADKIDGLDLGRSSTEKGQRTALGAKLRSKRNMVVGGFKITPAGTVRKTNIWRLLPTKNQGKYE